jgi:hypothetical protein
LKAGILEEEKEKLRKDWEHSLNPGVAAVKRQGNN